MKNGSYLKNYIVVDVTSSDTRRVGEKKKKNGVIINSRRACVLSKYMLLCDSVRCMMYVPFCRTTHKLSTCYFVNLYVV